MKTLITILIISSFLQSTILPIDLVLIILICRSYLRPDRANLLLAFSFGLLHGYLNLTLLGFSSILYLLLIQITASLSKSRLAGHPFLIIPLTFILLSIYTLASAIFIYQSFQLYPKIFLESALSLPIFYLIRLWEERFIVRKEIKLRV